MAEQQASARPFLVVLTGGPSSGKSSALALLRDRLSARGFQVLTVPENATHFLANSDGFQPEWAGTDKQVEMQRIFLNFQISQEDSFKAFAGLHPTKRAVLLLDCCTINSKVYVSDEQWSKVLGLAGHEPWTEGALFARYDLVVHMMTCAMEGHYEWGPGSNNPGRYHTPEQAKEQDARCLQVFQSHPQLRVVPHCPVFNDKIEKVAEFVNDALQIEGLTGRRTRRTCRVVEAEGFETLAHVGSISASMVSSTFVDDGMRQSVRQKARLSSQVWLDAYKWWQEGGASVAAPTVTDPSSDLSSWVAKAKHFSSKATHFSYERRHQVVCPVAQEQSYLTRRMIPEEDYCLALDSRPANDRKSTTKFVLRFFHESQYYELFFFLGCKDLVLDFSADACEVPKCFELGQGELERKDSESDVPPRASEGPPPKKPRILRAHSTEEAALFGG
jgi:hypothetical protein